MSKQNDRRRFIKTAVGTALGAVAARHLPALAGNEQVAKGAEKGYFAFGGSSTLTLFEPGAVRLETDLLENSRRQIELYARIGSQMGRSA